LKELDGGSLAIASVRILVAEDFAPFRRAVTLKLRKQSEFQIISEVSDGLEAVQKAKELQPDLVLLDVGLPTLSGIEAARRIRTVSPQSKIVFVSQEFAVDVVQAAFRSGASAYVIKSDVGRDLLIALDAVLRGETFVSRRLAGQDLTRAQEGRARERTAQKISDADSQQIAKDAYHHEAVFYSTDYCLMEEVLRFVGTALKVGHAAIVVATEPPRARLLSRLQANGVSIDTAIEEGRYTALNAADTLSQFVTNGVLDEDKFMKAFGALIETAARATARENSRVAIFGECVQLLCAQNNVEAAIQMERLGNELTHSYDVDILCGYALSGFDGELAGQIFKRICALHSLAYSWEGPFTAEPGD